ncbi:hypothetical protein EV182_000934 [Spiromyces aspiralis]|uniref:Uncharacterized protein n=1 Tax=Spiromyces aspiralis TaxID=68401 RepID=A0ACC1HJQ0_9FUNG|nr:hypothetical protein EV182_000934 [Spiromyces aspiralis]
MSVVAYTESVWAESQDERWDDWEDDEMDTPMKCLFCSHTFQSAPTLFQHCEKIHGFDFLGTKKRLELDFYSCMRVVNYIRKMANENFAKVSGLMIDGTEEFLKDDEYLKPTMDEDALLYALDELDLDDAAAPAAPQVEGFEPPANEKEHNLMMRIKALEHIVGIKDKQLEYAQEQFDKYRKTVRTQFLEDLADGTSVVGSELGSLASQSAVAVPPARRPPVLSSDAYFDSYAHNDIHEQMLKDRVRTDGYRDFIYENKGVFKDKVVLDVGCGTGILSMFAARAGAKKVYAVDNSNIVEKARENIKDNELEDIVTVMQGQIEHVNLPVGSVDIIVSEWMGYFLLFEAMLDSVLVARDRFLAPGGLLAPSSSRIYLTAVSNEEYMNDRVHYWDNVYGFKMPAMKGPIYPEVLIEVVDPECVVANSAELVSFDHHKTKVAQLDFVSPFELIVTKECRVHALVGYFDVFFGRSPDDALPPADGDAAAATTYRPPAFTGSAKDRAQMLATRPDAAPIHGFTTGPHGEPTHWKQSMFLLASPIDAAAGDRIVGAFDCHKHAKAERELDINVYYRVVRAGEDLGPSDVGVPAIISSERFIKQSYRLR